MVFDPSPLRALFEDGRERGLHAGLQLHVKRGEDVLLDVAWGETGDGSPLTPQTRLLWMSSGKPFTAVGLARLVEGGQLSWDDPVVRFIPEFAVHGKEAVTLRHILTHTGGFRQADLTMETDWTRLVAAVAAVKPEPGWVPGEKAGYHSAGSWTILGEVIRRVTGRMPDDWLAEEVYAPFGLASASLGLRDLPGFPVSQMQLSENRVLKAHPIWSHEAHRRACWPGSTTFATARDLARFYQALLEGGRGVLSPETVKEMTGPQREGLYDHTFKFPLRTGLGFILDSKTDVVSWHSYGYGRYASHDTFGHGGNQSSVAFADPGSGLVVAAAYNAMPGELPHQGRMRALLEAVYQEAGLG
ncbi:MAG: serine hydrolase domain-containing protein [Candidatus Methylacidiphilales bacterium]|nr:serine hydrolase domain-containing protein [Candidatus Methylacidiphilales bacterium]